MSRALERALAEMKTAVDERLLGLLCAPPQHVARGGGGNAVDPLDPLPQAARDALLSPGKRIRPAVVFLAGELFGCERSRLLPPACAIEMVHAASLVLDDLPSMDDATTRRGRPALHIAHGEAAAVLSAVTLLTRAFGVLAEAGLAPPRDPSHVRGASALDLLSRLADACGLYGLSSGQALDLRTGDADAHFDRLETIHARKTGALFVAAAEFGAVLGGAREKELASVRSYAKNVGLAFQIVDDLLEDSPAAETGKAARRPSAPTFARHLGREGALRLVGELTEHAVEALAPFGRRARLLADLAAMLRDRRA